VRREIFITADGSTSFHIPQWNEQYHSKHGAIQEAYHVFIKAGLNLFEDSSSVSILEIGFGTGLNAFITFLESMKRNLSINYVGVEKYPLSEQEIKLLNYVSSLNASEFEDVFKKMHNLDNKTFLKSNFSLTKRKQDFNEIVDVNEFDLIYFDAFGARVQPELWTESIFKKMFIALKNNGALVTYSAKGSVRRAMLAVGFEVEKIPGPKGKREMLRAFKK
jgi:tRNA U34 5-methylaminomethyl-2-thiouridine-forming methyltransferase MnmC